MMSACLSMLVLIMLVMFIVLVEMTGDYADSDILIISACRTPIGRFCGSLASIPTHKLGATVISECIRRVSCYYRFDNVTLSARGVDI